MLNKSVVPLTISRGPIVDSHRRSFSMSTFGYRSRWATSRNTTPSSVSKCRPTSRVCHLSPVTCHCFTPMFSRSFLSCKGWLVWNVLCCYSQCSIVGDTCDHDRHKVSGSAQMIGAIWLTALEILRAIFHQSSVFVVTDRSSPPPKCLKIVTHSSHPPPPFPFQFVK